MARRWGFPWSQHKDWIAACWRLPATRRPCLDSRSERGTRADGDTDGNRGGYSRNPVDLCPSRADRHGYVRGGAAFGRGNGREVHQGGWPWMVLAGGGRCDRRTGLRLLHPVPRPVGLPVLRRG